MKSLRDTLMNPKKRLPMSTLDKCEKVLQNWQEHTNKPSQVTCECTMICKETKTENTKAKKIFIQSLVDRILVKAWDFHHVFLRN